MADGKIVVETGIDESGFEKGLEKLGEIANNGVKAAVEAVATFGTALVDASHKSINMAAAFENSMAMVSTLFGDVSVDTNQLDQDMLALSSSVGYSANTLRDSLCNALLESIQVTKDTGEALYSMGETARQIVEVLNQVFSNEGMSGIVVAVGGVFTSIVFAIAELESDFSSSAARLIESFSNGIEQGVGRVIVAISRVEVAVVNGLAKIIPQAAKTAEMIINEFAKKLGNISPILKPLVETVKSTGDKLSGLSKIVDIVSKAFEGFKLLKTIDGWLGTFNKTTDVLNKMLKANALQLVASNGGLTLYEMIVGVLTGKITLVSAATAVWNFILSVNPIVWIVGAIALLVGGIALLSGAFSTNTDHVNVHKEKLNELEAETEETKQRTDELTTAIQNNSKEYENSLVNIEAEAYANEQLATQLFNLSDKENKSAAEKQKMSELVKTLNERLPELKLNIDGESGALDKNKDQVFKNIAANKELLQAKAKEKYVIGLYEQEYKLQQDLEIATGKRKDAEKALHDMEAVAAQRKTGDFRMMSKEQRQAITDAEAALPGLRDNLKAIHDEENKLKTTFGETSEKIKMSMEEAETATEPETIVDNLNQTAEGTKKVGEEADNTKKKFNEAGEEITADSQNMTEQLTETYGSLAEALRAKGEEAGLGLSEGFQVTKDGITYEAAIAKDGAIMALNPLTGELFQIGVDGGAGVDTGFRTTSNGIIYAAKDVKDGVNNELDKTGDGVGADVTTKVAGDINAGKGKVGTASRGVSEAATGGLGSQNQAITALGTEMINILSGALMANIATSNKAANNIAAGMFVNFKFSSDEFNTLASSITEGLANALRNYSSIVSSAARQVAKDAYDAAKIALEVNSPSKKFMKLGKSIDIGLAKGITDNVGVVDSAMVDIEKATELNKELELDFGVIPPNMFKTGKIAGQQFSDGFLVAIENMKLSVNGILGSLANGVSSIVNNSTITNNTSSNDKNITQNFYSQITSPYEAYKRQALYAD